MMDESDKTPALNLLYYFYYPSRVSVFGPLYQGRADNKKKANLSDTFAQKVFCVMDAHLLNVVFIGWQAVVCSHSLCDGLGDRHSDQTDWQATFPKNSFEGQIQHFDVSYDDTNCALNLDPALRKNQNSSPSSNWTFILLSQIPPKTLDDFLLGVS